MADEETTDDSLSYDIGANIPYEAAGPANKRFLPWHRPRKQLVRERQWRAQIARLINELPTNVRALKYLGLPGDDLLDLRFFHDAICLPNSLDLQFLGFNSGAKPNSSSEINLNISLDEVRKLERVDSTSEVITDDFDQLGRENSIAAERARQYGPFDIINLDLCNGIGSQEPGVFRDTHYNAVSRLLALQARNKNPWLLLLTTRVGYAHVNDEVLKKIVDTYKQNLESCVPFQRASREYFQIDEVDITGDTNEGVLINIFLTGICKWLLKYSLDQNPPTTVELLDVIGYRVMAEADNEDLVSLAIKFTPTFIPSIDRMDFAYPPGGQPSECEQATHFVLPILQREDADAILLDNDMLNCRMVDATAELLEQARYNKLEYYAWVDEGCPGG